MDMNGERMLPAARERVWAALNDPAILRASIPGCRSLEPAGDDGFRAAAAVRIGAIATNFSGEVRLADPTRRYRIASRDRGTAAGRVRARQRQRDVERGRRQTVPCAYQVKAEVGGKTRPARRAADRRHGAGQYGRPVLRQFCPRDRGACRGATACAGTVRRVRPGATVVPRRVALAVVDRRRAGGDRTAGGGAVAPAQGGRIVQGSSFLKKKNQKTFANFRAAPIPRHETDKSLFASFSSEKEDSFDRARAHTRDFGNFNRANHICVKLWMFTV